MGTKNEVQGRVVQRIKLLAGDRKILLLHLADRSGVSRSHFWDVLGGRKSPTLAWLAHIAEALEVDVEALFLRSLSGTRYEMPSKRGMEALPKAADREGEGPTGSPARGIRRERSDG